MGTLRHYVIHRLVASGLTLFGVSCIVFVMVRLLPGDPARVIAGLLASEEEVTAIRRQLGLDQALYAVWPLPGTLCVVISDSARIESVATSTGPLPATLQLA